MNKYILLVVTFFVLLSSTTFGQGGMTTPLLIKKGNEIIGSANVFQYPADSSVTVNGGTLNVPSTAGLSNNAVTSDMIQNGAIAEDKLANEAVTPNKIQNSSIVGYIKIVNGSINSQQVDNTILKIDSSFIGDVTGKISNVTVTGIKNRLVPTPTDANHLQALAWSSNGVGSWTYLSIASNITSIGDMSKTTYNAANYPNKVDNSATSDYSFVSLTALVARALGNLSLSANATTNDNAKVLAVSANNSVTSIVFLARETLTAADYATLAGYATNAGYAINAGNVTSLFSYAIDTPSNSVINKAIIYTGNRWGYVALGGSADSNEYMFRTVYDPDLIGSVLKVYNNSISNDNILNGTIQQSKLANSLMTNLVQKTSGLYGDVDGTPNNLIVQGIWGKPILSPEIGAQYGYALTYDGTGFVYMAISSNSVPFASQTITTLTPTNYSITDNNVAAHLNGIDRKLSYLTITNIIIGSNTAPAIAGMIRYNSSITNFEGFTTNWSLIAGTGNASAGGSPPVVTNISYDLATTNAISHFVIPTGSKVNDIIMMNLYISNVDKTFYSAFPSILTLSSANNSGRTNIIYRIAANFYSTYFGSNVEVNASQLYVGVDVANFYTNDYLRLVSATNALMNDYVQVYDISGPNLLIDQTLAYRYTTNDIISRDCQIGGFTVYDQSNTSNIYGNVEFTASPSVTIKVDAVLKQ